MALETLKGVEEIGGFKVVVMDDLREKYPDKFRRDGSMHYEWFEKEIRPNSYVYVRNDKNSISFTIQNGPVKEVGVNGCQIDTMAEVFTHMLKELNKQFPCRENSVAITHFETGIMWLLKRKIDREKRGVEGHSKP